jgi:2-amino-4-hydroxy-6-hydroxymethyldihydropteridine diphosphokinase
VEKVSPIYEFPPQGGPKNQPKYLNLTVKIKTLLTPLDLLDRLKLIERELKRKNTSHWGPRTIDLDILFYDDLILVSRELSLPHPLLHKRIFVLKPLSDIASGFKHPLYKKSIKYLFKKLENENNN